MEAVCLWLGRSPCISWCSSSFGFSRGTPGVAAGHVLAIFHLTGLEVVGVKVRLRLKLDAFAGDDVGFVDFEKLGNLLVRLKQGAGEHAGDGLVSVGEERGSHTTMADATGATC